MILSGHKMIKGRNNISRANKNRPHSKRNPLCFLLRYFPYIPN